MCYTPTKYELLWVNENNIRIDLHVFDNADYDILCIIIRYDDFFNGESHDFSDYDSTKDAHNDFCEYIKERMEPYDDCPDADFQKVRGYKTVYKKACSGCKEIITELWKEKHDIFQLSLLSQTSYFKHGTDLQKITEYCHSSKPVEVFPGYYTVNPFDFISFNKNCDPHLSVGEMNLLLGIDDKKGLHDVKLIVSDITEAALDEFEKDLKQFPEYVRIIDLTASKTGISQGKWTGLNKRAEIVMLQGKELEKSGYESYKITATVNAKTERGFMILEIKFL